mgnify:CR=1 FL=1|jgi:hypothetical protein
MSSLVRLVYVSRALFVPMAQTYGIEPAVTKILFESRRQNIQRGLVGVLYYGNGYFLQCIEGEKLHVDQLYEKLQRDIRHTDLKVLSYLSISQVSFYQWRMKYMPMDYAIQTLLKRYGMAQFNPYQLSADAVTALLYQAVDGHEPVIAGQLVGDVSIQAQLVEEEIQRERTITMVAVGFFILLALFSISMILLSLQLG